MALLDVNHRGQSARLIVVLYGYQRRGGNQIDYYREELLEAVKNIAEATDSSYVSRRMIQALNALSYTASCEKAQTLMKEADVQAKNRTKHINHKQPVFDNVLDRQFEVNRPD